MKEYLPAFSLLLILATERTSPAFLVEETLFLVGFNLFKFLLALSLLGLKASSVLP